MNTLSKIFLLTSLFFASQSAFADYYQSNANPSPNGQFYYEKSGSQYVPDTSGERAAVQYAQERGARLQNENRNMIWQDTQMTREGYDANQGYYYGRPIPPSPQQNSGSRQEMMMRGQPNGYPVDMGHQSYQQGYREYNQSTIDDQPRSFPIDDNYPDTPHGSRPMIRAYPQQGQNLSNYQTPNAQYPTSSQNANGATSYRYSQPQRNPNNRELIGDLSRNNNSSWQYSINQRSNDEGNNDENEVPPKPGVNTNDTSTSYRYQR